MRSVFVIAASLAAAAPVAASAQATAPIVVSGKYQNDWNRGSKLEAEGLKALEEAERDRVRASADIVNAQNRSESSDARAANAAEEFRRLTASTPPSSDAGDALRWANNVQRAAQNWARYTKRGNKGDNAVEEAGKQQRRAEEAIRKAQEKVDRGRAMKAEAERRSISGA